MPSYGDYCDVLGKQGFLTIYGSLDFMNHLKFNSFMESAGLNKLKFMIVFDQLNFPKSALNKFRDINEEYSEVSFEENEFSWSIVANLLNITMIKNRWLAKPDRTSDYLKDMLRTLAKNNYVGATLRQIRK